MKRSCGYLLLTLWLLVTITWAASFKWMLWLQYVGQARHAIGVLNGAVGLMHETNPNCSRGWWFDCPELSFSFAGLPTMKHLLLPYVSHLNDQSAGSTWVAVSIPLGPVVSIGAFVAVYRYQRRRRRAASKGFAVETKEPERAKE